jgi:hypothetical protein
MERTARKRKTERASSREEDEVQLQDNCMPGIVLSNREVEWTCFVDSLLFALLYRPSYYIVHSLINARGDVRDKLLQLARDINTTPARRPKIHQLPNEFFLSLFTALSNDPSLLNDFLQHTNEGSLNDEDDDDDDDDPPFGDVIEVYNGLRDTLLLPPLTTLENDLHTFETQIDLAVNSEQNVFDKLQRMDMRVLSDTLIIPINRIGDRRARLTNIHEPPATLVFQNTFGDNVTFHLCAVVNYKGGGKSVGHYTCYVRCNDIFYYTDDIEPGVFKQIGSYADLLKTRSDKVQKQGLLFIYKDLSREGDAQRLLFADNMAPVALPPPFDLQLPVQHNEDDEMNKAIQASLQPQDDDDEEAFRMAIEASKQFMGGNKRRKRRSPRRRRNRRRQSRRRTRRHR